MNLCYNKRIKTFKKLLFESWEEYYERKRTYG